MRTRRPPSGWSMRMLVIADRLGIEDDAVLSTGNAADVPQGAADGGLVAGAAGEEVDIPGRPQLLAGPHAEERGALQGENGPPRPRRRGR